jgi:hypothetical protein
MNTLLLLIFSSLLAGQTASTRPDPLAAGTSVPVIKLNRQASECK